MEPAGISREYASLRAQSGLSMPFGWHFFDNTKGGPALESPTDAVQDDIGSETTPFERIALHVQTGLNRHTASTANLANWLGATISSSLIWRTIYAEDRHRLRHGR
jgi:hypothetical protein